MNNEVGEDLSWFWKEWFYPQLAIRPGNTSVSYPDNDPKNGVDITIANLQKMAMPCKVELILKDGSKLDLQLPVETWLQSSEHPIHLQTTQPVQSVTVDPENKLPDSNRKNNVWKE